MWTISVLLAEIHDQEFHYLMLMGTFFHPTLILAFTKLQNKVFKYKILFLKNYITYFITFQSNLYKQI